MPTVAWGDLSGTPQKGVPARGPKGVPNGVDLGVKMTPFGPLKGPFLGPILGSCKAVFASRGTTQNAI